MFAHIPIEFGQTGNSAVRLADPENPTVEPNMKWIGRPLAEIWPFEISSILAKIYIKQDNVRTNTESVQCHHVFDTAYVAPLYEITGRHRLRNQSIRHRPIPTVGPLQLILYLLPF